MDDLLPTAQTTVDSATLRGFGNAARTFASYYLFSWAGVALGLVVNRANQALDKPLRALPRSLLVALKIALVVLALLGLQRLLPALAFDMQAVTGGVFFVAFYFGTQTNLLSQTTW